MNVNGRKWAKETILPQDPSSTRLKLKIPWDTLKTVTSAKTRDVKDVLYHSQMKSMRIYLKRWARSITRASSQTHIQRKENLM